MILAYLQLYSVYIIKYFIVYFLDVDYIVQYNSSLQ